VIDALHAEWTKLRTLPTTGWLFVGAVALTVASGAGVAAVIHIGPGGQHDPTGASLDPTKLSLTGVYLGQAVVAILAVLSVAEEYGTGMIRASLAAVPRRPLLLGAKATTVGALAFGVGVVVAPASLLIGHALLPAHGVYPLVSLGSGPTLRAAVGTALYFALVAMLSLGVATTIRDTAVSIGAALGLLYVLPIAAQLINDPTWQRHLAQIAPMTAGLAIQATTNLPALPISPWAGLGVLSAWACAALIVAALSLRARDA
jgi:ABC-2 type transport system permease protein